MQWMKGTKDDATWEKANDIIAHYLDFVVAQSNNAVFGARNAIP